MIYLNIYLIIGFLVGIYLIMAHLNEHKMITLKTAFSHFLLALSVGPLLLIYFVIDEYILPLFKTK